MKSFLQFLMLIALTLFLTVGGAYAIRHNGLPDLLAEWFPQQFDPDYNKHMDIQQAIKLALLKECRKRGISFAYPTQTLYLAPTGNWPAANVALQPAAMKGA